MQRDELKTSWKPTPTAEQSRPRRPSSNVKKNNQNLRRSCGLCHGDLMGSGRRANSLQPRKRKTCWPRIRWEIPLVASLARCTPQPSSFCRGLARYRHQSVMYQQGRTRTPSDQSRFRRIVGHTAEHRYRPHPPTIFKKRLERIEDYQLLFLRQEQPPRSP